VAKCFAGCTWEEIKSALRLNGCRVIFSDGASTPLMYPRAQPEPVSPDEAGRRAAAYQLLLDHLTLTDRHRGQLQGRGLTNQDIDLAGYRSLDTLDAAGKQALHEGLTAQLVDTWRTVPGLVDPLTSGLLVPYRDPDGRIQGFQVRRARGKYRWFGKDIHASCTPHVPLACRDAATDLVRVIEGGLKADVVVALEKGTPIKTVAVAGAGQWKAAVPLLEAWGTKTVRLAFDQDDTGRKYAGLMAEYLKAHGYQLEVEDWDAAVGKGLDDVKKAGGQVRVVNGKAARDALGGGGKPGGRRRMFLSMAELMALPSPRWLVDGFVQEDTLAIFFGDSGAGKSFLAVEMSASIASGTPFLGKYKVRQGPVVYVAAEGGRGYKKRLLAWAAHHNRPLPEKFHLCPDAFDFKDPNGVEKDALLAAVREAVGEGGRPALLVVDTLSQNLHGSESKDEDMGAFVRTCNEIRAELGCTVLIIHHVGHTEKERERGNSNLLCNLDTRFLLTAEAAEEGCVWLVCKKQRDTEPTPDEQIRKVVVDLRGEPLLADVEEKDRNSLVMVPVVAGLGVVKTRREAKKLAQQQQAEAGRAGKADDLVAAVAARPGLDREGLAEALDISVDTLKRRLKLAGGRVRVDNTGKAHTYWPADLVQGVKPLA
jgi:hypothetical protein